MGNINTLDQIVSLCKRRGYVYPTSEIYGGLTSSYDYGPLGVELLRSIRSAWWQFFITDREDMVGLDSQILLHPQTWVASGHVASFSDPMVEDTKTHKRFRADHLIEGFIASLKDSSDYASTHVENLTLEEMAEFIKAHKVKSPDGNPVSAPKTFNLLFETKLGAVEDTKSKLYLRGETAQGIFTNFKNVTDSTRIALPFGIGQIGKSFRNEITTGQFIFRTLELEQAEIEYFFDPEKSPWESLFKNWQDLMWHFVTQNLGVNETHVRWRKHTDKERSHYSKQTYDLDYQFPFGWKELWGLAYRTDYDLKLHMQHSHFSLEYTDPFTQKKIIPHVIEPAVGVNRLFFMLLAEAFTVEEKRIVLKLPKKLAPVTVAVFPLLANKDDLVSKARVVYELLKKHHFKVSWDGRGNIGKRYLSQDEAGTPWCVTVDFDTLSDDTITIRDRDTTKQERISIGKLTKYLEDGLN